MTTRLSRDFDSLPLFDLDEFRNGGPSQREKFVSEIRHACHHVGFFYVRYSGISPSASSHILKLTRNLFDLPQGEKDRISINFSPHFRGYGKFKQEMTLGCPDHKESFDLGREKTQASLDPTRPYLKLNGPNQWPRLQSALAPDWKTDILGYLDEMQKLGEILMDAIALTLELPEKFFSEKFCAEKPDSYSMLRLLKYPALGNRPQNVFGVGPHIDSGCLVILLQDEVGGLQVQNSTGEWVNAPPVPGTFVVNIGKMLQIWSNNYFLATPHRVLNSPSRTRYSVPFFFEPRLHTVVTPLSLPESILKSMDRAPADPNTEVIYGQYMLEVFERSFPKEDFNPLGGSIV